MYQRKFLDRLSESRDGINIAAEFPDRKRDSYTNDQHPFRAFLAARIISQPHIRRTRRVSTITPEGARA